MDITHKLFQRFTIGSQWLASRQGHIGIEVEVEERIFGNLGIVFSGFATPFLISLIP